MECSVADGVLSDFMPYVFVVLSMIFGMRMGYSYGHYKGKLEGCLYIAESLKMFKEKREEDRKQNDRDHEAN